MATLTQRWVTKKVTKKQLVLISFLTFDTYYHTVLTFHCERLAVEWNTKYQLSSVSSQADVMPKNSVLHKHTVSQNQFLDCLC